MFDGGPISPDSVNNTLKRVLERAGIPKVRFRDLRHTYVSQLQAQGVPMETIQSLTGHADVDMKEHYLHVQKKVKENAAGKWMHCSKSKNRLFTSRKKVGSNTIRVWVDPLQKKERKVPKSYSFRPQGVEKAQHMLDFFDTLRPSSV